LPHHRRGSLIALACALLVAGAGQARAERLPRVAVVVLLEVNVAPEEADALAAALGDAIRTRLEADVIAGREVRRRLPAGQLPASCAAEPACLRGLGERLEADKLLLVIAAAVGEQVQLDLTWADPTTGETLAREALLVGGGGDARIFTEAAPRLLPELSIRQPRPVLPIAPAEPEGRHLTTGSIVSGGIALASLAGGIGLALAARSEHADLENDPCAMTATCDASTLRRYTVGADALFATALVAGVVAVWLYAGSADDEPAVVPVATGDAVGLWFSARF
jgi:hypothetical protein